MKYIFLSFLLGKYGLTTDLKSAYHSVETTEISNNLRLLVWVRDINGDKTEWNDKLVIVRLTKMQFGDACSSSGIEIALRDYV